METSARPWSIRGIVGESGALWSSDAVKIWTVVTLVVTATIAPLQVSVQPMADANAQQTEDMRVLAAEDEYVAAEVSRDEASQGQWRLLALQMQERA